MMVTLGRKDLWPREVVRLLRERSRAVIAELDQGKR